MKLVLSQLWSHRGWLGSWIIPSMWRSSCSTLKQILQKEKLISTGFCRSVRIQNPSGWNKALITSDETQIHLTSLQSLRNIWPCNPSGAELWPQTRRGWLSHIPENLHDPGGSCCLGLQSKQPRRGFNQNHRNSETRLPRLEKEVSVLVRGPLLFFQVHFHEIQS